MSTLNSEDILQRAKNKSLILRNFDEDCIKEVCYEVRASNEFYDISPTEAQKTIIKDGSSFILRPNNQVVSVTMEYLDIPLDIIARILLVGHYFSLGIAPVNTYADPGFKGKLGIVFSNTSKNYIKITPGERIAKVEFSTLTRPSVKGYVGQHGGEVCTWPFRKDLILSEGDYRSQNVKPNSDKELEKLYGNTIKNVIKSTRFFTVLFSAMTSISILLPVLFIWALREKWNLTSPLFSILIGIITGVISNFFFYLALRLRRE